MGTGIVAPVLALLTPHPQFPFPIRYPRKSTNSQNYIARRRYSSAVKAGGRVGGSEWEKTQSGERPTYQDEFNYDYDEEEEFGFGKKSGKQRVWWSDDSSTKWWDTSGGGDEDDDDDEEDGFGVLEGSIGGFSSIFEVLRTFGWMVPAIIISLLLGTGANNALLMAVALPLAQSALSSVLDLIWERAPENRRPKSRSRNRKRPFSGASSGSKMRQKREQNTENDNNSGDYKSWVAADNVSERKDGGRARSFGGWDELDEQRRKEKERRTATSNKKRWETSQGKLSKRSKRRQTPLLVRLLIAFFPFLGFWTKLW
ncbi:OLC1v1025865C1 [Oldenlandia corymbosa var. corymbosa]|uniref:OLC1v1025865C1 n=1 Tax=Oldenlandia corymbosa var. corymbosa TaxID=529605 RepID=A0AAV1C690_OLDCO|nr:OLC1v1025865C1 [Oldenlandia corymbosa var. corymbosa]